MNLQKQRYNTKQETILIDFFEKNSNKHFNADEVCSAVVSEGISRATVYRRLERLVEDGILLKFNLGNGLGACYQFCNSNHHGSIFHFVCTNCKSVKHLDCSVVDDVLVHLTEHHNLQIDNERTVFYGLCEECLK